MPLPHRTQSLSSRAGGTSLELVRGEYSSRNESEESVTVPMLGALILRATSNPFPRRKPVPQDMDGARKMFLAKQEARRLRRTLKERGDFLGVTGVNPVTGEMDVLTPTSSSEEHQSGLSVEQMNPQLALLARRAQQAREEYEAAQQEADIQRHKERQDKAERYKEAIRLAQQPVKWRREEGQWSSVAEPGLSPIAQSTNNTPEKQSSEATTIHRNPGPFLGVGPPPVPQGGSAKQSLLRGGDRGPAGQPHGENASKPDGDFSDKPVSLSAPSPPRTKSIRLRFPPLIPRRLGSRSNASSTASRGSSETGESKEGGTEHQGENMAVPRLDLENQNPADR
jgi:hypothetical protein